MKTDIIIGIDGVIDLSCAGYIFLKRQNSGSSYELTADEYETGSVMRIKIGHEQIKSVHRIISDKRNDGCDLREIQGQGGYMVMDVDKIENIEMQGHTCCVVFDDFFVELNRCASETYNALKKYTVKRDMLFDEVSGFLSKHAEVFKPVSDKKIISGVIVKPYFKSKDFKC